MELSEYKNIYRNEKSHFFYVSTHKLVLNLIRRYIKNNKSKILDAGCGTGGLIKQLEKSGDVWGVDYSDEALRFAKKRGVKIKQGSIESLPFENEKFDLVTSVDVIYHKWVKDDIQALKEMGRVLKKGGFLILRVPANKFLYSAHDKHVLTVRRYSKKELERKVKKAGFVIKQISYVHSPIFILSLVKIIFEKVTGRSNVSSVGKVPGFLNNLMTKLLNFEAKLIISGISMPFGQGLVCVAERK